jgi:hypothetical protein
MSPSDFYVKNIFDKFGYIANWFPSSEIRIGDIGVMEGYYFKRKGSLDQKKLSYNIRKSEKPIDFSYSCQAELNFTSNIGAEALTKIAAGAVKIKFKNAGAFVFEAADCIISEIDNKLRLGDDIKKLYKNDNWDLDWVIIDTIISSGSSTILVSNSKESELELTANANIPQMQLTDTNIDLKIQSQRGELTRFLATQGLSPLFKTSKIKVSFLNRLTRRKNDARFGGHNAERIRQDYEEKEIWENIIL